MKQRKLNEEVIHCIIDSLIDLLKEKPFEDISIVEIIRHAGVSRNSFYRNFSSKEDILVRHINLITDDFIAGSTIPVLRVPWDAYVAGVLKHLDNNREVLEILGKNGKLYLLSDIFDKTVSNRVDGQLDEYHTVFLSGGLFNIYRKWADNGYEPSPDEVGKLFAKTVLGI